MKRSMFSEERTIKVLQEAQAWEKARDVCWRHGICEQTLYRCKAKYGGKQVSDVRRLKQLLAEATVDNQAIKEILAKNW